MRWRIKSKSSGGEIYFKQVSRRKWKLEERARAACKADCLLRSRWNNVFINKVHKQSQPVERNKFMSLALFSPWKMQAPLHRHCVRWRRPPGAKCVMLAKSALSGCGRLNLIYLTLFGTQLASRCSYKSSAWSKLPGYHPGSACVNFFVIPTLWILLQCIFLIVRGMFFFKLIGNNRQIKIM